MSSKQLQPDSGSIHTNVVGASCASASASPGTVDTTTSPQKGRGRRLHESDAAKHPRNSSVKLSVSLRDNHGQTSSLTIELANPDFMVDKVLDSLAEKFPVQSLWNTLSSPGLVAAEHETDAKEITTTQEFEWSPKASPLRAFSSVTYSRLTFRKWVDALALMVTPNLRSLWLTFAQSAGFISDAPVPESTQKAFQNQLQTVTRHAEIRRQPAFVGRFLSDELRTKWVQHAEQYRLQGKYVEDEIEEPFKNAFSIASLLEGRSDDNMKTTDHVDRRTSEEIKGSRESGYGQHEVSNGESMAQAVRIDLPTNSYAVGTITTPSSSKIQTTYPATNEASHQIAHQTSPQIAHLANYQITHQASHQTHNQTSLVSQRGTQQASPGQYPTETMSSQGGSAGFSPVGTSQTDMMESQTTFGLRSREPAAYYYTGNTETQIPLGEKVDRMMELAILGETTVFSKSTADASANQYLKRPKAAPVQSQEPSKTSAGMQLETVLSAGAQFDATVTSPVTSPVSLPPSHDSNQSGQYSQQPAQSGVPMSYKTAGKAQQLSQDGSMNSGTHKSQSMAEEGKSSRMSSHHGMRSKTASVGSKEVSEHSNTSVRKPPSHDGSRPSVSNKSSQKIENTLVSVQDKSYTMIVPASDEGPAYEGAPASSTSKGTHGRSVHSGSGMYNENMNNTVVSHHGMPSVMLSKGSYDGTAQSTSQISNQGVGVNQRYIVVDESAEKSASIATHTQSVHSGSYRNGQNIDESFGFDQYSTSAMVQKASYDGSVQSGSQNVKRVHGANMGAAALPTQTGSVGSLSNKQSQGIDDEQIVEHGRGSGMKASHSGSVRSGSRSVHEGSIPVIQTVIDRQASDTSSHLSKSRAASTSHKSSHERFVQPLSAMATATLHAGGMEQIFRTPSQTSVNGQAEAGKWQVWPKSELIADNETHSKTGSRSDGVDSSSHDSLQFSGVYLQGLDLLRLAESFGSEILKEILALEHGADDQKMRDIAARADVGVEKIVTLMTGLESRGDLRRTCEMLAKPSEGATKARDEHSVTRISPTEMSEKLCPILATRDRSRTSEDVIAPGVMGQAQYIGDERTQTLTVQTMVTIDKGLLDTHVATTTTTLSKQSGAQGNVTVQSPTNTTSFPLVFSVNPTGGSPTTATAMSPASFHLETQLQQAARSARTVPVIDSTAPEQTTIEQIRAKQITNGQATTQHPTSQQVILVSNKNLSQPSAEDTGISRPSAEDTGISRPSAEETRISRKVNDAFLRVCRELHIPVEVDSVAELTDGSINIAEYLRKYHSVYTSMALKAVRLIRSEMMSIAVESGFSMDLPMVPSVPDVEDHVYLMGSDLKACILLELVKEAAVRSAIVDMISRFAATTTMVDMSNSTVQSACRRTFAQEAAFNRTLADAAESEVWEIQELPSEVQTFVRHAASLVTTSMPTLSPALMHAPTQPPVYLPTQPEHLPTQPEHLPTQPEHPGKLIVQTLRQSSVPKPLEGQSQRTIQMHTTTVPRVTRTIVYPVPDFSRSHAQVICQTSHNSAPWSGVYPEQSRDILYLQNPGSDARSPTSPIGTPLHERGPRGSGDRLQSVNESMPSRPVTPVVLPNGASPFNASPQSRFIPGVEQDGEYRGPLSRASYATSPVVLPAPLTGAATTTVLESSAGGSRFFMKWGDSENQARENVGPNKAATPASVGRRDVLSASPLMRLREENRNPLLGKLAKHWTASAETSTN